MSVCLSACRWLHSLAQSLQPVLEAVGVYRDSRFNEVGLSLHTLVKESLSLQPCSLLSIPSNHSFTTPATRALQTQLSVANALLKGNCRSIWGPNSRCLNEHFMLLTGTHSDAHNRASGLNVVNVDKNADTLIKVSLNCYCSAFFPPGFASQAICRNHLISGACCGRVQPDRNLCGHYSGTKKVR